MKQHRETQVSASRFSLIFSFIFFFIHFAKTPLDISRRLNDTTPPARKLRQYVQTPWGGLMRWRSEVIGRWTSRRDAGSRWKQSEGRAAVDVTGKQQIHLHLVQHKYLYEDLHPRTQSKLSLPFPSVLVEQRLWRVSPLLLLHSSHLYITCFLTSKMQHKHRLAPRVSETQSGSSYCTNPNNTDDDADNLAGPWRPVCSHDAAFNEPKSERSPAGKQTTENGPSLCEK